ncbi:MAG: cold shock domain-containing protein [Bacteroidetes bacterium]|nr:MAG: cold shock domain-containing protein [Bacteroidota bacterium]
MAKSQETFNKKEKEKKRLKKRKEKQEKRDERRANSEGGGLDVMMAYLDEDGNIVDTPPDPLKKKKVINAKTIEVSVPKKVEEITSPFKKGRVEFFNDSKGFGFIKELDTQEKYFVHVNGLIDDIQEGDKVAFELERGMKGMNAVRVKKEE